MATLGLVVPAWVKKRGAASVLRHVGDNDDDLEAGSQSPRERTEQGEPSSKVPRKLDSKAESKASKGNAATASAPRGGGYTRASKTNKLAEAMDRLTIANAELGLENKVEQRESKGYLERVILVPTSVPLLEQGLEESAAWNTERNKNKGKNIGASHVRIFTAAMMGLAEWPATIADKAFSAALRRYWELVVSAYPQDQLLEEIQVFKIFKPKVSSKVTVLRGEVEEELGEYARVVIRLKPGTRREALSEEFQTELLAFARMMCWKVTVGTPPKTKRERALQSALNEAKGLMSK